MSPLLLAAPFLLWAALPASAGCLGSDAFWQLAASAHFASAPFSTLASRADVPEACRREVLARVADHVSALAGSGLCPRGSCGDLAAAASVAAGFALDTAEPLCAPASDPRRPGSCLLTPAVARVLGPADARVADVVESGIRAVEAKLAAGTIPYCLLSEACLGGEEGRCRVYLRWLWWMGAVERQRGREMWLQSGGFPHLLVGDAFTCSVNLQRGGTCAIYSASALISHYCATPARNPAVRDSCAAPSGVQCPLPEPFLQRAMETGCWTARTCASPSDCRPAVDEVTVAERQGIKRKMDGLGCAGAAPPALCSGLAARLAQLPPGAPLLCLAERVYPTYGFSARFFPGTNAGWNDVRRSVQSGHPVQVHISPALWSQYFGMSERNPGRDFEHAVVLEAFWTDDAGSERVLLRDSNNTRIVALPSPTVRSSYVGRPGGVAICLPGDSRCPPYSGEARH